MASLNQAANLNIMELSRDTIVTIKFKRMKEWTLRVKVGSLIMRFAFWILPFGVDIIEEKEPWLFYCPYCKQATSGKILAPLFTQRCRECRRTFLAISYDGGNKARAVQNPDCSQGCAYAEPFGWVISADCTLHDEILGG